MKTGYMLLIAGMALVLGLPIYAEEDERPRPAGPGDRRPLIAPSELEAKAVTAAEQEAAREDLTVEERVDELEYTVRTHERMLDPYNHRDELRLENRLRDLEEKVERMERELRRMEERLRASNVGF